VDPGLHSEETRDKARDHADFRDFISGERQGPGPQSRSLTQQSPPHTGQPTPSRSQDTGYRCARQHCCIQGRGFQSAE